MNTFFTLKIDIFTFFGVFFAKKKIDRKIFYIVAALH